MKKHTILLIAVILFSNSVSAVEYLRNRTITGVGVTYSGDKSVLLITVDGEKTGMPACAVTGRFGIDSSSPHYKEMVSLAMTAYASKQNTVDIAVVSSCNYHANSRDMIGIKMGSIPW